MSTYGSDWTPDQNRIIVEAYFDMLGKQQNDEMYIKSEINRTVVEQTGKTRGSVEWKFCNISYLLEEMGYPIIRGYKPARNTQRGTLYHQIAQHLVTTQYTRTSFDMDQQVKTDMMARSSIDPRDVLEFIEQGSKTHKNGDQAPRLISILKNRWIDNKTLEEIAAEHGMTRERVRQLQAKAIKWVSEFFADVGTQHILDRLAWIEESTTEAVGRRGGYATIDETEGDLRCPSGSLRFWFFFNTAVGLLNPKQKNLRGVLKLGGIRLTKNHLSVGRLFEPDQDTAEWSNIIREIVGTPGVMRLDMVLSTIDDRFGRDEAVTPDILARGLALETKIGATLLLNPEETHKKTGIWISIGLGRVAREVARAIISMSNDISNIQADNPGELSQGGVRSDQISKWLEVNSRQTPNTRAVESICQRTSQVFARTGPSSWGLIGAGAQNVEPETTVMADIIDIVSGLLKNQPEVSTEDVKWNLSDKWSSGWIERTIDLGLEYGYLINAYPEFHTLYLSIGKPIPGSQRVSNRKAKPQEHGLLMKLVVTILEDEPGGISEEQMLRRIRETIPETSADSIYVYLKHTLKDTVEITPDKLYRRTINYGYRTQDKRYPK